MDKKLFSLVCAVLCSFIWGPGFIAQDMGMDFIGPYTFSVGRFFIGFLSLMPFFFIFEFTKIKKVNINNKALNFIRKNTTKWLICTDAFMIFFSF